MVFRLLMTIITIYITLTFLDPHARASLSNPSAPQPLNFITNTLCPGPPSQSEIITMTGASPIIIAGRLRQRHNRPSSQPGTDARYNASVLVTTRYKTDVTLPDLILVGEFFTPSEDVTEGPGCLDAFYPNSKYIFFLRNVPVNGDQFYEFFGRPTAFSEKIEKIIYKHHCTECYPPKIQNMPNQKLDDGERLMATCAVAGLPLPNVVWIRDGKSLNLADSGLTVENIKLSKDRIESVLEISSLVRIDSGEYKCVAENPLGEASASFMLLVSQTTREDPQLLSRELVPCGDERKDFCLNGGQCYMLKSDRNVLQCRCSPQYFGDRCHFYVEGLLAYSETRDSNLENMFKEVSHEIITHLSWSIWGSFAMIAALLLFIILRKHEPQPRKSTKRQKKLSETSTRKRQTENHAPNKPLIHITDGGEMQQSDDAIRQIGREHEYLGAPNSNRPESMQSTHRSFSTTNCNSAI
ncbi:unnamed protein product [Calicophoron daubneyi]|uniref:Uncharacterized protein n=1 Tax=Calicophoron daubneyi TaxID=300641 RepID=A0AAV2TQ89_CALDB